MRPVLILPVILSFALPSTGSAQDAPFTQVEVDRTKPPAEFAPASTASAKGVQIYRCAQEPGEVAAAWVFVGPEAKLYADAVPLGEPVGTHSAGPTWRWSDGSAIAGKVLLKRSANEAGAVPWLLLSATRAPGSSAGGQLQDVVYVRRWATHGGAEPASGCDAAHLGGEARVPYTAKYTFYKASR